MLTVYSDNHDLMLCLNTQHAGGPHCGGNFNIKGNI